MIVHSMVSAIYGLLTIYLIGTVKTKMGNALIPDIATKNPFAILAKRPH